MPRHVGVHLHHSCHVACSAAWKTNMPGHCGKPSESVMECHLMECQDVLNHHVIQDRTSDVHCAALETDTAFPTITKQDQIDSDMMNSHENSFSYATLPLPLQSLQAVHPWSPIITQEQDHESWQQLVYLPPQALLLPSVAIHASAPQDPTVAVAWNIRASHQKVSV